MLHLPQMNRDEAVSVTWDGLQASTVKPFGAAVVVYRKRAGQLEFLLLHRAHKGADYEGDWAWTPPSGCRFPDEPIETCARRELMEEAGLDLEMRLVEKETPAGWQIYIAEASADVEVNLIDPEHDRHQWLSAMFARKHCEPAELKQEFQLALDFIAKQL